jgi:hypothetical protein
MTKIAGALNMLPKTMLQQNITNPSTNVATEFISDIRTGTTYPNVTLAFISDISNIRDELRCYIRVSRSCSIMRDELSYYIKIRLEQERLTLM